MALLYSILRLNLTISSVVKLQDMQYCNPYRAGYANPHPSKKFNFANRNP